MKYLQENMCETLSKVTTKLKDVVAEDNSKVSRMSGEDYLSGTDDDLISNKTAQKYASGSDTDNDDKDDYEDKNIGCDDNTLDVVMDFDIVDEGSEEDEMDSQAIFNVRQIIPSSSEINFKFQHEEHLDSMQNIGAVEKLISNRALCDRGTPFYSQCSEFQQSTT